MSIRTWSLLSVFLGVLGIASPASAEEGSPAAWKAGDEALASKEWAAAESSFSEALDRAPRCWQAREGLARALDGLTRGSEALAARRRAVRDADLSGNVPAEDRERLLGARKALAKQDPLTRELHKLMADATKGLVRFASSKKKTPAVADAALRRALRVDPLCAPAHEALEKQGLLPFGVWVPQFHGTFDDWGRVNSREWKVLDETSFSVDGRQSAFGTFKDRTFSGDFDMRADLRIDEHIGEGWSATLAGAASGDYDRIGFGIGRGQIMFTHIRWDGHRAKTFYNMPVDRLDPPVVPGEFNRYELQFRGDSVTALVNGRLIAKARRAFHRHRGSMGVMVQLAKATFRNLEVRQR